MFNLQCFYPIGILVNSCYLPLSHEEVTNVMYEVFRILCFIPSFIHLLFSCGLSTHNKHDDDDVLVTLSCECAIDMTSGVGHWTVPMTCLADDDRDTWIPTQPMTFSIQWSGTTASQWPRFRYIFFHSWISRAKCPCYGADVLQSWIWHVPWWLFLACIVAGMFSHIGDSLKLSD